MMQTTLALLLGSALVSANSRFLQNTVSATINNGTTCTITATAATSDPCGASPGIYCCMPVGKNGPAPAANVAGTGLCMPVDFAGQAFLNVSGANYTFGMCAFANTTTNYNTAYPACPAAGCATGQCCGSKAWSLGGVASATTATTTCIPTSTGAQTLQTTAYLAASPIGAISAMTTATCPAAANSAAANSTANSTLANATNALNNLLKAMATSVKAAAVVTVAAASALLF
jgi:hypothetical protein